MTIPLLLRVCVLLKQKCDDDRADGTAVGTEKASDKVAAATKPKRTTTSVKFTGVDDPDDCSPSSHLLRLLFVLGRRRVLSNANAAGDCCRNRQ